MVSHSELCKLIEYDFVTGHVTWKVSPSNNVKKGDRAGTFCKSRKKMYRNLRIKGVVRREHCWIWFLVTGVYPDNEIDHKNGDGTDNRWTNLRKVTPSVNRHNCRKYSSNKSGVTGVFWNEPKKSWLVTFCINGKQKRVGQRKDFFEACCLRKSLEHKNGYSKQHGSNRDY